MRAITLTGRGGDAALREVVRPSPGPGDVLVEVHAAGVNPYDLMTASNETGASSRPVVVGHDFAGVAVLEDGGGSGRVRTFGITRTQGSFCDYTLAIAHDGCLARIPDDVSDAVAAALPTPGLTAMAALDALDVDERTALLVHGASTVVGAIALQLAIARGALVVATVDGEGPDARALGADAVFDVRDPDVVAAIRRCLPEKVGAVLDAVSTGHHEVTAFAGLLRFGGAIVSTNGALSVEAFGAMGFRAVNVRGCELALPSAAAMLEELAARVSRGQLVLDVDREIPLGDVATHLPRLVGFAGSRKTIIDVAIAEQSRPLRGKLRS